MNRITTNINTPNVVMNNPLSSSSSSSGINGIDKLMASTATLATESSSISSIDTTFLGAAAHLSGDKSTISQEKIASTEENGDASSSSYFSSFFDDVEKSEESRADDAAGAAAALPAESVVTAMHENNTAYLRPRKRELHHLTLAVDILNELDNEESDDESIDINGPRSFFDNVERGLAKLSRPRKKERHFFSIAEDILQDLEGDE